mmetsp:Transcript_52062/g.122199  ORF Transcript_52062/g.122199 Transcript_52062/m.122199 type:complete len:259 (+) Transcript_52062:37-813(+)
MAYRGVPLPTSAPLRSAVAPCTPEPARGRRSASASPSWSNGSPGGTLSATGASWSPPSDARRRSKRRSISELTPTARMTPKELRARGMGFPWRQSMGLGLCKADVESFDAGRKLCLLPTPELKRQARRSSRSLPNSSPRSLQLSFSERVAKASLCLSSDSEEDDVTGKLSSPLFSPTRTEDHLAQCLKFSSGRQPGQGDTTPLAGSRCLRPRSPPSPLLQSKARRCGSMGRSGADGRDGCARFPGALRSTMERGAAGA